MPTTTLPTRGWAALICVYIVWGSTYLAIAVVVSDAPPLLSAGLRFLAAGLLLGLMLVIKGGIRRIAISRRELAGAALVGVLLLFAGNGGVSLAERYVPSGISALLVASVPLWVIALRLLSREHPAARTIVGVLFGLVGVAALVTVVSRSDPHPGTGYVDVVGWLVAAWMGVILLGSFLWAFGSFISPRLVRAGWAPVKPITSAFWQFLTAGLLLCLGGLATGESPSQLTQVDARTIVLWLLMVLGALLAYTCYIWLLQNAPISLVSTYAYVNPAVAIVLGVILLSEPLSGLMLVAAALVFVGVVLVVRAEARSTGSQKSENGSIVTKGSGIKTSTPS